MTNETNLWDLLFDLFGLNPEPETVPSDEFGVLYVPGG